MSNNLKATGKLSNDQSKVSHTATAFQSEIITPIINSQVQFTN